MKLLCILHVPAYLVDQEGQRARGDQAKSAGHDRQQSHYPQLKHVRNDDTEIKYYYKYIHIYYLMS